MARVKRFVGALLCMAILLGNFPAAFAESSQYENVEYIRQDELVEVTPVASAESASGIEGAVDRSAVSAVSDPVEALPPLETVWYKSQQEQTQILSQMESAHEGYGETMEVAGSVGGTCGDNVSWTLGEDGLLTITGTGEMKYYGYSSTNWVNYMDSITAVVIGEGITNIDYMAFYGAENLESVVMPSTLTAIEAGAFYRCKKLQKITFPEGLTQIDHDAFVECVSLKEIIIPDGVTTIAKQCFYGCSSVTNLVLPSKLTVIEDAAFGELTALTEVKLPAGLTEIGGSAFFKCVSLKEIVVPSGVSVLKTYLFAGCTGLEKVVISEGVEILEDNVFAECVGLREVMLPSTVTTLGMGAFWNCPALENVTLPANLTAIGYGAFMGCASLKEITLPSGVSEIAGGAFNSCTGLTAIWVDAANMHFKSDNGVLFSKDGTLLHTYPRGLQGTYTVPEGTQNIGAYAFRDNSALTNVALPQSLTSIGEYAFCYCAQLTNVALPENLQKIEREAFAGCAALKEIEIPGGVTNIESNAFYACEGLEKLVIHEGVETIGTYAFQHAISLTEVQLPSTLRTIEREAFAQCFGLTEIVIPENIERLGYRIFTFCKNLKTVRFAGKAPIFDPDTFDPASMMGLQDTFSAVAFYPAEERSWTDEVLQGHGCISQWLEYVEFREGDIASGTCGEDLTWAIRKDGHFVVSGNGSMGTYQQDTVPWRAFKDKIRAVTIGRGVTDICDFAFSGCENLQDVFMRNAVTEIGDYGFLGCKSLTGMEISQQISSLGKGSFRDCASLTEINIPAGVIRIGEGSFGGCNRLKRISVDSGNPVFDSDADGALLNDARTKLLAVPAGLTGTYTVSEWVKEIADYAFESCGKELQITFEENPPVFGENAFYLSKSVVYYPVANTAWTTEIMQQYGGEITWISYDDSIVLGVDVELHKKTEQFTIMLQAKTLKGTFNGNTFSPFLQNVTVSSILEEQVAENGVFSILQYEAAQRDIVLKKERYQDYVIPKAVSASLTAALLSSDGAAKVQYPLVAYMQKKDSSGLPYISTVFGREARVNAPYKDLQYYQLNLEEGSKCDIIISLVGGGSGSATYYVEQNGKICLSNKTGVFSAADLYSELDYGKEVRAYAVTQDGVKTEKVTLKITKMAPRSEELISFLKRSSISLLGSDGNIVLEIPEEFPLVGGGKLDLAAFEFPMGIHISGSSVKISLGVDIFSAKRDYNDKWSKQDEKEKDQTFVKFKNDFLEMSLGGSVGDALEEMDLYRTFMNKYSKDYSGYYEKKRNFDVEFLGYIEATVVNGQLVIKEILVNVKGEFTFRYTQQGAIWVIPAYYYVEAGAEIGLTGKTAEFLPGREMPKIGIILDIEPKLAVGGGVGVKNAVSAGLRGEGSLPFMLDFTGEHLKLDMKGAFSAEGEFFILKGNVELLSGEVNLIDWYYGNKEDAARFLAGNVSDELSGAVVSRDYDTSQWQGNVAPAVQQSGASLHALQTDVFNRSQPQIEVCGNGMIMVWVEDDPSRDAYNRMRLVYALYDEEKKVWSEPQPVYDDGHNDAYPSLTGDGTNIFVVWQKIDETLTAENCTGMDVLLNNSELFLAKFDTETVSFVEVTQLTDNDRYEYSPVVTLDDGEAVVYYASVAGNQVQEAKAHTLYKYTNKAKSLSTKRNYILSITARDGKVSYVMDADGDMSTTSDIGVYTLLTYSTTAFKKEDKDEGFTYAAYGPLNERNVLFVSDMYNIYYMENGQRKTVFEQDRSISGNISIVQNDFGTQILWTETEAEGTALYTVFYSGSGWTKPVKLAQLDGSIRDLDTAYLYGTPVGVCNTDTNRGTTDLNFFELRDFTDLKLLDYLRIDENTAVPQETMPVEVMVKNLGTTSLGDVCFTISDGIGSEQEVWVNLDLAPGNSKNVTLWYLVPEAYSETTMTVTAAVSGEQDADVANNTVSRVIGKPDLSVTENDIHVLADGYILNLFVENNSLVDARDVALTVALDEKNADPIYTQAVGTLSRDTYASVHVSIPTDRLVVDEQGVAMIYISVESACADATMGDNTICVVLYLPEEIPCEHTLVETVAGKEPDCTNEGYTAYERCQICDKILEGNETLPALGHDFSAWETVTEATCTDVGKEISRCVCGEENEREIPALGHSYADGVCAHCGKPDADAVLMGDVSGDGQLSYIDALMILRYSLGMDQMKNPAVADISGDGNINYNDALIVLRISIGLA